MSWYIRQGSIDSTNLTTILKQANWKTQFTHQLIIPVYSFSMVYRLLKSSALRPAADDFVVSVDSIIEWDVYDFAVVDVVEVNVVVVVGVVFNVVVVVVVNVVVVVVVVVVVGIGNARVDRRKKLNRKMNEMMETPADAATVAPPRF